MTTLVSLGLIYVTVRLYVLRHGHAKVSHGGGLHHDKDNVAQDYHTATDRLSDLEGHWPGREAFGGLTARDPAGRDARTGGVKKKGNRRRDSSLARTKGRSTTPARARPATERRWS